MNNEFREWMFSRSFKIKVENITQVTQEEFALLRTDTFGASDSSKLLGVNPFPRGLAEELIMDKVNNYVDDSISKKPTVRMGADLEDFCIDRFRNATGYKVLKPDDMWFLEENGLTVNFDGVIHTGHSTYPWLVAEFKVISVFGRTYYNFRKSVNIDNGKDVNMQKRDLLTLDEIIGDFDIVTYINAQAENCGIPAYYYTQVQQEIMFAGGPYGFLIALDVQQWTLRGFKIPRDDITINTLRRVAKNAKIDLEILKNPISKGETTINPL